MAGRPSQSLSVVMLLSLVGASFAGMGGCSQAPRSSIQSVETISAAQEVEVDYAKAALANVKLGLGYLSQGQAARAKQKLAYAMQLAPNLAEPHAAMAFFLEQVGDYTEAEKEHKKAIKAGERKGKGAVYNNYGAFLCRRGRLREADQVFQRALQDKYYPCTAEVYENAGLCAAQAGDAVRAEQYFSKAIQHDPKRLGRL